MSTKNAFCVKCGASLGSDFKFCGECGQSVPEGTASDAYSRANGTSITRLGPNGDVAEVDEQFAGGDESRERQGTEWKGGAGSAPSTAEVVELLKLGERCLSRPMENASKVLIDILGVVERLAKTFPQESPHFEKLLALCTRIGKECDTFPYGGFMELCARYWKTVLHRNDEAKACLQRSGSYWQNYPAIVMSVAESALKDFDYRDVVMFILTQQKEARIFPNRYLPEVQTRFRSLWSVVFPDEPPPG